jgi:two-component system NarL family sensor kinase
MDAPENSVVIVVVLVSGLLLSLVVIFSLFLWKQQQRNLQLERRHTEAEIQSLEDERRRIAQDLHDEIGSYLSALTIRLNAMEQLDAGQQRDIDEARKILRHTIDKLRATVFNILPPVLALKGFTQAVRALVRDTERMTTLVVELDVPDEPIVLSNERAVHLYRICQEALNNCVKYAEASQFSIVLHRKHGMLLMLLADNGNGFSRNKPLPGLGLKNIQSRVDILNGKMDMTTAPGKGVKFTIMIPEL